MDRFNAVTAQQAPQSGDIADIADIIEALAFVAEQGCPELAKDAGVVMRQYPEPIKQAAWTQLSTETRRSLQQLLRDGRAA